MASVRLGRETRETIINAAAKAFEVANPEPDLSNDIKDDICTALQDHPAQAAARQFVEEYGTSASEIFNIDLGKMPFDTLVYTDENATSRFKLATKRSIYGSCSYSWQGWQFGKDALNKVEPTKRFEILSAIEQVRRERADLDDQRRAYNRAVDALVSSCNTLKQLLDAQPSMKEFVPDELLREMHKKVTRESQARERREIAEVDSDMLNRVVLTSKLVA